MPQSNVDVVGDFIAHFNETRGEPSWELIDPDVELVIDPSGNLTPPLLGHKGIRVYLKQLGEVFDRLRLEVDDVVDAGELVVVLGRLRAHGKASDIDVEQPMGWVFRVRDGRIDVVRTYVRPDEALVAAGLRPPTTSTS